MTGIQLHNFTLSRNGSPFAGFSFANSWRVEWSGMEGASSFPDFQGR